MGQDEASEATSEHPPVFVVGPSRSGTALMRSMLNNHPDVHLAGETHYFDDLRTRIAGPSSTALVGEDREAAEAYFLALSHRPYGHSGDPAKASLDRLELRDRGRALGGSADAYFQAFCELAAEQNGKAVWGEKTPRHVFRIDDILDRFPAARIVCMVRDPRAVVASYRDWSHQGGFDLDADPEHRDAILADERRARDSYHLVTSSLLWRSAFNAGVAARRSFGSDLVRLQRFEDLLVDPERAARSLAGWLGLTYDPAMLDVPVHNSSFATFDPKGGISEEAARRWTTRLSDGEVRIVQALTKKEMKRCGYPRLDVSPAHREVATIALTAPAALLRAGTANRNRMDSMPRYVWRRLRRLLR